MVKRTYQPKNKKRVKTHGFRQRRKSQGGRLVLKRRKLKKRKNLNI